MDILCLLSPRTFAYFPIHRLPYSLARYGYGSHDGQHPSLLDRDCCAEFPGLAYLCIPQSDSVGALRELALGGQS